MAQFDLITLYHRAFGPIASPYINTKLINFLPLHSAFDKPKKEPGFQPREHSLLGTPLFMPCTLDNLKLPNEPIVQVDFSKTIIKTPIDDNAGTFKEVYALNDYDITIRGLAVNEDEDDYPEEFVRALRTIVEKRSSVSVVCRLLSIFEVNLLSIERLNMPAIEGFKSVQPYELICTSDKEIQLELKNP